MSHDKIKAAARRRMTATGEPYAVARREDVDEHKAAQFTSAVSAEDIRAAAEAHRELGPDYSDAVVASFIDSVDKAVAARVEARLAGMAQSEPAKPGKRGHRLVQRRVARDVLAVSAGALVAVGAVGLHGITSPHPVPHASSSAAVHAEQQIAARIQIIWMRSRIEVQLVPGAPDHHIVTPQINSEISAQDR
jgi:hypothetical protein